MRVARLALMLAGGALLQGQTAPGEISFAAACALGREDLILAAGLKNPALGLLESERYLAFPFGRRVLERLVREAPDEAVDVFAENTAAAGAAREALLAAAAPELQLLSRLSQDRAIDLPTRRRVALLAPAITRGALTLPGAVKLAGDSPRYFAALADARVAAAPSETPAFDRALEFESRVLCRAVAESAGRSLPRELTTFRARDLYLLLAFGRAEAEGPVFAAIFDRLLLPKLRAERPVAASLLSFLERSGDWALRDFTAASAAARRVDIFLQVAGAGTLSRLTIGIDQANDPQREAIRVAEVIAATAGPAFLSAMAGSVLSEYARCSRSGDARATLLYGLLAARLAQTPAATPALREAGSAYLPLLASAEQLDIAAMFGENNVCIQRYFFYDDGDGVESFESFLDSYEHDPAWTIEDRGEYVRIVSRAPQGRRIEIFANKPVDSHLPANRGREFEAERRQQVIAGLLAQRGAAPALIVHRGHSFYVSRTVKQVSASVRLVFLGSCGGVTDIAGVIERSHQAQVIATRGVGAAEINDPLLKSLNDRLLVSGPALDWSSFWQEQQARFGRHGLFRDYIAPNREPASVFLRAYYLLLDRN